MRDHRYRQGQNCDRQADYGIRCQSYGFGETTMEHVPYKRRTNSIAMPPLLAVELPPGLGSPGMHDAQFWKSLHAVTGALDTLTELKVLAGLNRGIKATQSQKQIPTHEEIS